jgi:hypothetical protein
MLRQGLSFIYQDVRSFHIVAIDWHDRPGVLGLLLPQIRMLLLSMKITSFRVGYNGSVVEQFRENDAQ